MRALFLIAGVSVFGFGSICMDAKVSSAAPAAAMVPVGRLQGSSGNYAHLSPDGSKLLTTGGDVARIWDVRTLKPLTGPIEHGDKIDEAGWTAAGDRVFTAGGKEVRFWDARTERLATRLSQNAPVDPTCISPDGRFVVTGNAPGPGVLWDAHSGKPIRALKGPGTLRSAAFSDDGKKLLLTNRKAANDGFDTLVRVIDPKTGSDVIAPIATNDFSPQYGPLAALSPDGTRIAVAVGKAFKVFGLARGKELFQIDSDALTLDSGYSEAIHFTRDGSGLVWSIDEWTRLYDATTGKPLGNKTDQSLTAGLERRAAFSRDGKLMFLAGFANQAGEWDMHTGRRLQAFGDAESECVDLSPDESLIAVPYQNRNSPRDGFTEVMKVRPTPTTQPSAAIEGLLRELEATGKRTGFPRVEYDRAGDAVFIMLSMSSCTEANIRLLPSFSALQRVAIWCPPSPVSADAISGLGELEHLVDLQLRGFRNVPVEFGAALAKCRSLKRLRIEASPIDFRCLLALKRLQGLQNLGITDCQDTDDAAVGAMVTAVPRLKSLDLSRDSITAACLASLSRLADLRHLTVRGTGITQSQCRHSGLPLNVIVDGAEAE